MCELDEDDGEPVEILVPNTILVVTFLLTGFLRWISRSRAVSISKLYSQMRAWKFEALFWCIGIRTKK
jgi:hypothetical protein